MTRGRHRFTIVEYAQPVDLIAQVALAIERPKDEVRRLLAQAGTRTASALGFEENPITSNEKGTRAKKVAGLLRIAPSVELEIAPKFLGTSGDSWREDFFFLATLSKHGRLLASERLAASGGAPPDLSGLVARAMTGMYWDQHRRPLRTYRREEEVDFFLEGDIDPTDLAFPDVDGYKREAIRLTRNNRHNALVSAAAKTLAPQVSDPRAAAGLQRISAHLGEQRPWQRGRQVVRPLPSRSRRWQPLVDLSLDVVQGLGLAFEYGTAAAPGFVVATWQIWQDLLTTASRLAFGAPRVHATHGYQLGNRIKSPSDRTTPLKVYPDLSIDPLGAPPFLLDAKYKGHVERGRLIVSEADIYEAVAFSQASARDMVILAYPAPATDPLKELGATRVFERVNVGGTRIIAIYVEVRGISRRGGLNSFSARLADELRALTAP
ncbi:restriction endonuclease [Lysobacter sp. H23M47]|nr:restriction endonuclease [Lysobacter sp. H23M47]